MKSEEGKAKLLSYRVGETLEQKKLPRFLEDDDFIGTAENVGSTAISVLIYNGKVFAANLGDSRATMAVDDGRKIMPQSGKSTLAISKLKVVELSKDHKPF